MLVSSYFQEQPCLCLAMIVKCLRAVIVHTCTALLVFVLLSLHAQQFQHARLFVNSNIAIQSSHKPSHICYFIVVTKSKTGPLCSSIGSTACCCTCPSLFAMTAHLTFVPGTHVIHRLHRHPQHSGLSMQQHPVQMTQRAQELFLAYAHFCGERGVEPLIPIIKQAVIDAVSSLDLSTKLDADQVLQILSDVHKRKWFFPLYDPMIESMAGIWHLCGASLFCVLRLGKDFKTAHLAVVDV